MKSFFSRFTVSLAILAATTTAAAAAHADCDPKCTGQQVCRYDGAGKGRFYCADPPKKPDGKTPKPDDKKPKTASLECNPETAALYLASEAAWDAAVSGGDWLAD